MNLFSLSHSYRFCCDNNPINASVRSPGFLAEAVSLIRSGNKLSANRIAKHLRGRRSMSLTFRVGSSELAASFELAQMKLFGDDSTYFQHLLSLATF